MQKHAPLMLKMHKPVALGIFIALSMTSTALNAAPPEGKGKPDKTYKHGKANKQHHDNQNSDSLIAFDVRFDDVRRIAIANRYTGYESLPPGIQMNLARGKPLPPGIAKKAVPEPLLQQLPVYPGYEWGVYGTDLVLIGIASGIIQQVLTGVFQ